MNASDRDNLEKTAAPSHPKVVAALKSFSLYTGYFIIVMSLFGLIGWTWDIFSMKTPTDPLLIIPFFFLALVLILLSFASANSPEWLFKLIRAFLITVIFFTLLRFLGTFLNSSSGLNKMLFGENFRGNYLGAISTTVNFTALSMAFYFIDFEYPNKLRPSQFLSIFVIFSSLFVVLGYGYNVHFHEGAQLTFKALTAMLFFILLSLANLCLRPDQGIITLIASDSMGGTLARRLLPACFVVPPLLGLFGIWGEHCGIYNKDFLLVIVITLNVVVFSGLIWWLANILHVTDAERNRLSETHHQTSLTDDLTGLFNRRGFRVLAEQQIKVARRSEQACVMFFADMDGLKRINDSFGHKEGDQALIRMAQILKSSFRESDIIARFSGDEFAVLCISEDPSHMDLLAERLKNEIELCRQKTPWLPYVLSFSFGVSVLEGKDATIEKLMLEADKKLYEIKRKKKNATSTPLVNLSPPPKITPPPAAH